MAQRAQASAIRLQQQIDAAAQVGLLLRVPASCTTCPRTATFPLLPQLPPEQGKAALMAAGMTPLQAHNALAAARDGGSGGGSSGGVGGGSSAGGGGDASRITSGPAKAQPGLVRAEDNPDGRRMRAVFMGANDIVGTLQARLLSLGMFRSLGNQRRQARTGGKLLFLGLCMRAIRSKAQSRRTTKLFAAGLFDCLLLKQRARARLALQFFTLGQLRLWFRRRQAAMRATLAFAAGLCMRLHFKRRIGIFAKAMFALALGPMMKVRAQPRGPPPGGLRLPPPAYVVCSAATATRNPTSMGRSRPLERARPSRSEPCGGTACQT